MENKKNTNFLKGAAILAAGGIFTKFLGLFFRIPLTNIIGDYGMGLYEYAYPLYSTFVSLSTAGIPVAVSRLVSQNVTLNNYKQAYKIFYTALAMLAILGGVFSVIMYTGANLFVELFTWDPQAYYCIIALSVAPLFVALISVVRGFFLGMQIMTHTSVSQVLEQIGRVGVGLALAVYLTKAFGEAYGAAGATFGATSGAIVAFVYLYLSFLGFRAKNTALLRNSTGKTSSSKAIIKSLVFIAIPIAFGGLVSTVMQLINSATIADCLVRAGYSLKEATELYGRLSSKAQTLVNVPLIIGTSLASSLVPSISQSLTLKDTAKARAKATLAVRTGLLVSMPSAVGLSVLSGPIISLLYGSKSKGADMLMILAYVVVFNVAMSSLQGILQGAGHYYKPLKNMLLGALVKYLMNIALVTTKELNIYGAIYSTIFASAVIFILNYRDVSKYIGFDRMGWQVAKTLLASVVMGVFCKFGFDFVSPYVGDKIAVLAVIIAAIIIYFGIIIVTRAFTKEDYRSVRG